jgi:hypothetical protein
MTFEEELRSFDLGCNVHAETLQRCATSFPCRHRRSAWRGKCEDCQPGVWHNSEYGPDSLLDTGIAMGW